MLAGNAAGLLDAGATRRKVESCFPTSYGSWIVPHNTACLVGSGNTEDILQEDTSAAAEDSGLAYRVLAYSSVLNFPLRSVAAVEHRVEHTDHMVPLAHNTAHSVAVHGAVGVVDVVGAAVVVRDTGIARRTAEAKERHLSMVLKRSLLLSWAQRSDGSFHHLLGPRNVRHHRTYFLLAYPHPLLSICLRTHARTRSLSQSLSPTKPADKPTPSRPVSGV